MNFLLIALILPWGALAKNSENKLGFLSQGVQTALSSVADAVQHTVENTPIVGDKVFSNCVEPPPECPNENVTFWYYSRNNHNNPRQLLVTEPRTLDLEKNEHPWKVIIHGYTNSKDKIPNPELRSAYFKRGDYNLISVDYEPLARDKCYIQAVHNVPLISNCTSQLLDALMERNLFRPNDLHVIGFSLGAQIAGQIHEFLKHEKPRRVTGLDPASPLFDGIVNDKLSRDSGKFVDVIHTNGLASGKLELAGHADFYVNGGLNQPGCLINNNGSVNSCSHRRGPLYFAESINSPEGFWGVPCSDYVKYLAGLCTKDSSALIPMGEDTPETARGTYFLQTSDKEPYALGKSGKGKESSKRKESGKEKESGNERESGKEREYEKGRESGKEREYEKGRESGREREYEKGRESGKEREYEKGRESGREREYEKGRESGKERESGKGWVKG